MPPKKVNQTQAKADQARKQKIVEDKTFGLKNKNKSNKVQKYVQTLQHSVKQGTKVVDSKAAQKAKKEEEEKRQKELNELFKVAVVQPKLPVGVDPKSVVCEFFRAGQCAKGYKCKFSHDLTVERKSVKIDLYSDVRRDEDSEEDGMEDWDQAKLESVIFAKGNEYQNANRPTDIVCKHFLEAVEKRQYGWFWLCPNGGKECQYRHALPPGYVMKSQMKQLLEEEAGKRKSVEEQIDSERQMATSHTTLTAEVFFEWKRKKAEERKREMDSKHEARVKEDRLSGRELFLSNASLFVDDAEACDAYEREERGEEKEGEAKKQEQDVSSSSSSAVPSSSSSALPSSSANGIAGAGVDKGASAKRKGEEGKEREEQETAGEKGAVDHIQEGDDDVDEVDDDDDDDDDVDLLELEEMERRLEQGVRIG